MPEVLRHLPASCMLMVPRRLLAFHPIHILAPHTLALLPAPQVLHLHINRLRHTMRLLANRFPIIHCTPRSLIPMLTQTAPPHVLLRHRTRMHRAPAHQCHILLEAPHPDPGFQ